MKLTCLLLVALLLLALPSRADSLYQVTGTATLTGNNACGGPCIETIDFTFNFDEQLVNGTQYTLMLVGYFTAPSGPLDIPPDNFPMVSGGLITAEPGAGGFNTNYLAFSNASRDEIDLYVNENLEPLPFIPEIAGMDMYSCNSATCVTDFCPSFVTCFPAGPNYGLYLRGTVTSHTEPIGTPEPSELGLTALGAALLGFSALCGWIPRRTCEYDRNLRTLASALTGTSLE